MEGSGTSCNSDDDGRLRRRLHPFLSAWWWWFLFLVVIGDNGSKFGILLLGGAV